MAIKTVSFEVNLNNYSMLTAKYVQILDLRNFYNESRFLREHDEAKIAFKNLLQILREGNHTHQEKRHLVSICELIDL